MGGGGKGDRVESGGDEKRESDLLIVRALEGLAKEPRGFKGTSGLIGQRPPTSPVTVTIAMGP
jgi:hypothetical protein